MGWGRRGEGVRKANGLAKITVTKPGQAEVEFLHRSIYLLGPGLLSQMPPCRPRTGASGKTCDGPGGSAVQLNKYFPDFCGVDGFARCWKDAWDGKVAVLLGAAEVMTTRSSCARRAARQGLEEDGRLGPGGRAPPQTQEFGIRLASVGEVDIKLTLLEGFDRWCLLGLAALCQMMWPDVTCRPRGERG